MKTNYIIYVERCKKTDKLVFKEKNLFEFYKRLLDIQKIKYISMEVISYDF